MIIKIILVILFNFRILNSALYLYKSMKNLLFLITLLVSCILLTGCNELSENSEITLDESQTNSFWIFHNTEEWTITLNNWEESITIMDKNLWAGVAWTWEESFWYYFQRWNNHWFQLNSEIKTWTELVSREESMQYWPNNRYDSDTQFVVLGELDRNVNYHLLLLKSSYLNLNYDSLLHHYPWLRTVYHYHTNCLVNIVMLHLW